MAYAVDTRRGGGRRRFEAERTSERQPYGALNAIGGINGYNRYIGSPCFRPPGQPIDPIYRGPCPPNPDGTDLEDVYAQFYQAGELIVASTSPTVTTESGASFHRIELGSTSILSDEGIIKERTRILIIDPGIYYIAYNINVPEASDIDTVTALLYDREVIPATAVEVYKNITGVSTHVSASALIGVDSNGAEIILGSTNPFTLTPSSDTVTASLIIFSVA